MTKRERWTVYPLLALCLLLCARDRLFPSRNVNYRSITCQELTVTSLNQERLVYLGEMRDGVGAVLVYGVGGDAEGVTARATADAPTRRPIVEIGGKRNRGLIRVRPGDLPALCLGDAEDASAVGLFAVDSLDRLVPADRQQRGRHWGTLLSEENGPPDAGSGQEPTAVTNEPQ